MAILGLAVGYIRVGVGYIRAGIGYIKAIIISYVRAGIIGCELISELLI